LKFDSSILGGYQFLDPAWLKKLHIIYIFKYLHMQPPLFNIFTSISFKMFHDTNKFWQLIFFILGLINSILLYICGISLNINRILLIIFIFLFWIFNPSVILYENWYFYTYPAAFLFTSYITYFTLGIKKNHTLCFFLSFLSLSILIYTRAIFQIILFPLIWILIFLYARHNFKKILLTSLIPFLLSFTLYLKNFLIFGICTTSSWQGMNLYKGISKVLYILEKDENYKSITFNPVENYEKFIDFKKTNVMILDEKYKPSFNAINFNHIIYIKVSKMFMDKYLKHIFQKPYLPVLSILAGLAIFSKPPYEYMKTWSNFNYQKLCRIPLYFIIYNFLNLYFKEVMKASPFFFVFLILVIIYMILSFHRKNIEFKIIYANLIYFMIISSLDVGENNRFRFEIEGILFICILNIILDMVSKRNFHKKVQNLLNWLSKTIRICHRSEG